MSPLILTIQTATPAGSLALTDGSILLGELTLNVKRPQTDWLMSGIDDLLASAAVSVDSLDALGVVIGPGSFTGLRVGLATVKGLSLATGKPLLTVSSLQTLAMQLPYAGLPVCAMLDARKKEVYAGLFRWEKGRPVGLCEERVLKPEDLLSELSGETLFIGEGASVYRTLIVRRLADNAHFAPRVQDVPRASAAAELALLEWEAGHRYAPEEVSPFYIRPSEAELNAEK